MAFWKRKDKAATDEAKRDDRLLHPKGAPEIELPTEYEAEMSKDTLHALEPTEHEILEDIGITPLPASEKHDKDKLKGGGWLSRLTHGLSKSSYRFDDGITQALSSGKLDDAALEHLEELLITADLGPKTAQKLIAKLRAERAGMDMSQHDVKKILAEYVAEILKQSEQPLETKKPEGGPRVYLVCGVNGVGKTTSIGKIAYQIHYNRKKKVMLAAGDTFRAAAIEQLQIWSERIGTSIIKKDIGSDSAALAYEAYVKAKEEQADILMVDTAGRLHNKANLMEELSKIVRVLQKHDATAPHEVLLVLDATTGQNALAQVETFLDVAKVTGLIVTKLDGSAKGGVVVALADKFGLPIYAIGVGETIEDLQPFKAEAYAYSLVGL
ncbi:MAG: signal recognition particle-docking protein FtsY [Alphaproteobacteria bacterium]|nr:signal recognition particle-docking protein FtsY [Alphaproteobacteria bacterium]